MKKTHRSLTACAALILLGVGVAPLANAASTTLTGTVRDFSPGALVPGSTNPDFESGIGGVVTGMVSSTLSGSAPTPVSFGAPGYITSPASFAQWYGPAAPNTTYSITLDETYAGSGIYSYSSGAFFPIDGLLLGNYAYGHNYHFTYQIAATFGYTPGTGQTFNFSGDDDVWVFFDKKLGIDLGGVHGSASQSVNLDTLFGSGKAAGNYAFDFFFAERHTTGSNLTITTSLNLVSAPVTPVPEPETWAMLLAGLGLMGFIARRRKHKEAAAAWPHSTPYHLMRTSNMQKRFYGYPAKLMAMLAMAVGLICSSSVYAGAQPHMLQATNYIGNPNLLIGFDAPQADGSSVPSVLSFDTSLPGRIPALPIFTPVLTISDVHNGATPQLFDVFFAVNLPGVPLTLNLPRVIPSDFQTFHFNLTDVAGNSFFDVFFDFSTTSGGLVDAKSFRAFNPQPDIPGFGADLGLTFSVTSLSDITLTMRVLDASGNQLSLTPPPVPEPETYAMLLAGLGLLGFTARRRNGVRRQAA